MWKKWTIGWFIAAMLCTCIAGQQLVPGMYCGLENCYDVLGVVSSSSKSEISRVYRKLARNSHPDYLRSHGASKQEIEAGVEKFHRLSAAYETLKDSREEYDYYLQHPEEYYYNYYRYYKHKMPNVDVRVVLFGTITAISIFQYISWMTSYNTAITYMMHQSKYRNAAKEEAKARGLWIDKSEQKKQKRFKSKEELKQDEDNLLRNIIEEKMDIRGGYQKPQYTDVLWMQLFLFPYYLFKFMSFHSLWIYNYTLMKKDYSDDAKIYLICKNIGIKSVQWDIHTDAEKRVYMQRKLWVKANAQEYIHEKQEEAKVKMAEDPKMKRYRRWMNKGGPGRMTFED
ncbi:dnaJ homolog subfamily C member 25-like [Clavelina lepadiformis]|uniref:DnaJ homolog subfamily C member 25 n=1 Tax=Clavelina lepadiformis TaxID=159417 RepID=A0ABP0GCX8_CLALP